MRATSILLEILRTTPVTKSRWSADAGVSRALLDDYLKGRKQPSVAQLDRLISATGRHLDVTLTAAPTPVPSALIEVLELGELFEAERPAPLPDLSRIWRSARG